MKRYFLVMVFSMALGTAMSQNILYNATKSEFSFYSKAPLEDIEAKNIRAASIINTTNLEIVVRIPVSQFQFSNKLMQQHFNENYMESEKYPYATFKGKINEAIDPGKSGVYTVTANGILNIHGIDQNRKLTGKLVIGENSMQLETKFDVMLADHQIEIPRLVFKKIAEKIEVKASLNYSPLKK
ncbi:MAG: YceI family protein [Pedobacter sp.]|jgi:hypothetical protein